jgi:hypothetical protein
LVDLFFFSSRGKVGIFICGALFFVVVVEGFVFLGREWNGHALVNKEGGTLHKGIDGVWMIRCYCVKQ